MSRSNVSNVRDILPDETQLTDAPIQLAIDAASAVIDQIASGCASHLSDATLTLAETYLAAHFASVTENTLSIASETDSCSKSSVVYGFKFGEGVKGTPFGQMAITLSGGCLANIDKTPARMFSLGSL